MWDYVGDNYVHRLIQSKTDGKLVELNHHCTHGDDGCGVCECGSDSGFGEALLNSKVEAVRYILFFSLSVDFCPRYFVVSLFLVLFDSLNLQK